MIDTRYRIPLVLRCWRFFFQYEGPPLKEQVDANQRQKVSSDCSFTSLNRTAIKETVAWDFWALFFINWLHPSPDSHLKIFSSSVAISPSYLLAFYKKTACIKHGSFWISMFQYMDIFESPCIETRRFKNFWVLYTEIFESPCIETRRLEYMNSLPYKTSMFQYGTRR